MFLSQKKLSPPSLTLETAMLRSIDRLGEGGGGVAEGNGGDGFGEMTGSER